MEVIIAAAITALAAIVAALIGLKAKNQSENKKAPSDGISSDSIDAICSEDRALFAEICDAFNDTVRFHLKDFNFYYPYNTGTFTSLDYILYRAEDPAFFFINREFEKLRESLFAKTESFINYLYMHSYPVSINMPGKNASHSWLLHHNCIVAERFDSDIATVEKEFDEEVEKINHFAREVWEQYSQFVKTGRVLLNNEARKDT